MGTVAFLSLSSSRRRYLIPRLPFSAAPVRVLWAWTLEGISLGLIRWMRLGLDMVAVVVLEILWRALVLAPVQD